MYDIAISVDVYCDWQGVSPRYRVYVDDYLLTERRYIWDNKELYVREHIVVELPSGTHYVKIQPVDPHHMGFNAKNITVNGEPVASPAGEFILD